MNQKTPHNTEHASTRQRKIEDCLLETMAHTPYDRISIADLCRRMGISRQLFYTYFPDKEACLISLLDRILQDSLSAYPNWPSRDIISREEIIGYLRYWQEHGEILDVIAANRLKALLIDRCYAYFLEDAEIIIPFLNTPSVRADNSILWLYSAIRFAVIFQWHEDHFQTPVEEVAAKYYRMLTQPLLH